jgi:hypothetical protein
MTDALAERFAALEDTSDTSDWPDVAQRVGWRRRNLVPPLALLAAAIIAGSAIGARATGVWVFGNPKLPREFAGITTIDVGGVYYRVNAFNLLNGRTCVTLIRRKSDLAAERCIAWPVAGRPFDVRIFRVGDTRIWWGLGATGISRVTIAGPGNRFDGWVDGSSATWIVALPASFRPRTISGYDGNGTLVTDQPVKDALR